jgi:phage FluMu protein Com
MTTKIKCPHCQELIEVTELLKKIDKTNRVNWGKAGALKRWGI